MYDKPIVIDNIKYDIESIKYIVRAWLKGIE